MLQDYANVKKAYLMKSKLATVHIKGLHSHYWCCFLLLWSVSVNLLKWQLLIYALWMLYCSFNGFCVEIKKTKQCFCSCIYQSFQTVPHKYPNLSIPLLDATSFLALLFFPPSPHKTGTAQQKHNSRSCGSDFHVQKEKRGSKFVRQMNKAVSAPQFPIHPRARKEWHHYRGPQLCLADQKLD